METNCYPAGERIIHYLKDEAINKYCCGSLLSQNELVHKTYPLTFILIGYQPYVDECYYQKVTVENSKQESLMMEMTMSYSTVIYEKDFDYNADIDENFILDIDQLSKIKELK